MRGVSAEQWRFKPAPGIWSIAENVEHIIIVQERLLGIIREQLPSAPGALADHDCKLVDSIVINQFPNRLNKFSGPEALKPAGDWVMRESLERVAANVQKFSECLQSIPDLRAHVLDSLPLKAITKGQHQAMDGYQWILGASAHTERHMKQILEVKADPNFPAS
jgi:hypothetical protein